MGIQYQKTPHNTRRGPEDLFLKSTAMLYLRDRILALNDAYEHYDDRDHEENVQEAAERVGRYDAEKPEHEKDCCNRIKHGLRVNLLTYLPYARKPGVFMKKGAPGSAFQINCDEP